MKTSILAASLWLSVGLSAVSADPIDSRFDGKWVGTEIFQPTNSYLNWASVPPQVSTVILIANSGKTLGFLGGFVPGRYEVSPKSSGNTIIFEMPNRTHSNYIGRTRCTLKLSGDGKTLSENGTGVLFVKPLGALTVRIFATFHRSGR